MKSCLGMLLILSAFVLVVGGGAAIWYLSDTAEFSRKDSKPAPSKAPATSKTPVPSKTPAPSAPSKLAPASRLR